VPGRNDFLTFRVIKFTAQASFLRKLMKLLTIIFKTPDISPLRNGKSSYIWKDMNILAAWIGTADLNASRSGADDKPGPIGKALEERSFDRVLLLANQDRQEVQRYIAWLRKRSDAAIELRQVALTDPTNFNEIYSAALATLEHLRAELDEVPELTFHVSPGTPAMGLVWIMLSATKFRAKLIQSSIAHGVQPVNFPFDLSAELLKPADTRLADLSVGLVPETYGDITFRSPAMARLHKKAEKAAQRSVPILIEGEPGTGQELLARAIHRSGPRKDAPFIALNCALAPSEQLEAELFGDTAAAVTGAISRAQRGTLFLDNIECLPVRAQARFLKLFEVDELLSDGQLRTDVRVIAATTCNLMEEVTSRRFSEDLFYHLAVLVLKTPPLRERTGDIGPLIETLLGTINAQNVHEPGYVKKRLSVGAKNFLIQHQWPGNLRELENTLRRAAVWSESEEITEAEALDAVVSLPDRGILRDQILGRPLEEGVDLQELMAEVARHYIKRAIEQSEGSKTIAAKLVGLPSHQTLSNWMTKYGVA
jgi:DNA-binding NtrC family response regulator